jgi:hypothetical protein
MSDKLTPTVSRRRWRLAGAVAVQQVLPGQSLARARRGVQKCPRLARLAVKYGAEILLDDLIVRLSADCPWRDDPRGKCGARFEDMLAQAATGLAWGAPAVSCAEGRKGLKLRQGSTPEDDYMTKDQWLVVVGILLTVIFGLAALITAKIVITAKTVRKRSQRQDVRSGGRAIQSGRDTKIEK